MIREYCRNNNKVLFDFADIERYDPEGNDYLDLDANDNCDYTGGNWAQQWCAANPGSDLCADCSCAHSQALNCNLKARAFWWMMARLAGWQPEGLKGDISGDGSLALDDGILGLQLVCGLAPTPINGDADVDSDDRIGLEEVMYVMQTTAGLRALARHSVSACKQTGSENFATDSENFRVEVIGNTLWVYHIDAVYNCCIEDIDVTVRVEGNVVDLLETEILQAPCDCVCPYDIATQVTNLSPGIYTVRIRNHTGLLKEIPGIVIPGNQACASNAECPQAAYCAKVLGECNGTGVCLPRPDACITLYDPVCGCDGKTYGNGCEASLNGVSVAYPGACQ